MENITLNGREYKVSVEHDNYVGLPWKKFDGHGVVSEWTRRGKRAGELALHSDRGDFLYYDYAASVKIAKRDRWGPVIEGMTKAQIAAKSAMRDYEYLRGWCAGEWSYVCVIVTAPDGESLSIGGLESTDTAYIAECASDLASELESMHQDRQTEEATI